MDLRLRKSWFYSYLFFLLSAFSTLGIRQIQADSLDNLNISVLTDASGCQKDPGNDIFALITTNVTQNFSQANNICKTLYDDNSNLARVDDSETYNQIVNNIVNPSNFNTFNHRFWVGVWDPIGNAAQNTINLERFKFLDGNNTKVSFIHDSNIWFGGEPNNGGDEDCAVWSPGGNKLFDVKCSKPLSRLLCRISCRASPTASPTQSPTFLPTVSNPGTSESPTFEDSSVNDPIQNVLKYIWVLAIVAVEASLIILFAFWYKMTRSRLKTLKKALVENEAADPSSPPEHSLSDYMPATSL